MLSRALFLFVIVFQAACLHVHAQPRFSIPSLGPPAGGGGGSMPSFSAPSIPDRPSISTPSMPDRPSITTSSFTPPSPSSSSLPDPSAALSTLSSMSSTLSSMSSSLPNAFQSTAIFMNQIPAIASSVMPSSIADVRTNNGDDYAGIFPSNAASSSSSSSSSSSASASGARAANVAAPSSSQSLSLSVAQSGRGSSTPVRGVSPFPYTPVDFVDPFNNPTNRIPEQPRASCGHLEVACQAYKRCYPCYADRTLSFCPTCLNLIRAHTANDQLKEMCTLCKSDASAMAICSMSEPYCPL